MNKEQEVGLVNKYESRLGEAESKRVALQNAYNQQHRLISEVIRAAKEYEIFIEKAMEGAYRGSPAPMGGYDGNITPQQRAQLAGVKRAVGNAIALYRSGVNKKVIKQDKTFWSMPDEPKTNDLFFDGEDYLVFYLGRWNKANPVKG